MILNDVAGTLLHVLFPHLVGVRIDGVAARDGSIRFDVTACAPSAVCPQCGRLSVRVHSRYQRRLADHAVRGREVAILLRVRRFRCSNTDCPRRIFAEQVDGLAERYQRSSPLLATLLTKVGLALGGRAGARMTRQLAAEVSRSTLLRLVRAVPLPEPGELHEVGVDDFALRRGHVYGTVLIDMETHRPIDLLGDRSADTLAAWLANHPGIRIICRDRGGPYADGARRGAPQAIQVADRWHLLHNLAIAIEKVIKRNRAALTEPQPPAQPAPPEAAATTPLEGRRVSNTRQRHAEVHALAGRGMNLTTICRTLNLDRKTVRRYLRAANPNELLAPVASRGGPLAAHTPYLNRRFAEGATNAVRL